MVSGKSSLPCAFSLISYIGEAVSLLRQLNSVVPVVVVPAFPLFLFLSFSVTHFYEAEAYLG